jgi:hypothetical protein
MSKLFPLALCRFEWDRGAKFRGGQMGALKFPQRYALLAKAWGFAPTGGDYLHALGWAGDKLPARPLTAGTVSRWTTGGNTEDGEPADTTKSVALMTQGLIEHFKRRNTFVDQGISEEDFRAGMASGDDLTFLKIIKSSPNLPTGSLENMAVAQGQMEFNTRRMEGVRTLLTGHLVMYRLGAELIGGGRTRFRGVKNFLRQIPIRVTSRSDRRHWDYEESYKGNTASGSVVVVDKAVSIIGDDSDREGFSELFFAMLDLDPNNDGLHEGVIVMIGDFKIPTAYQIIVLRAPDKAQDLPWDQFVSTFEQEIPLDLDADTGKFSLSKSSSTDKQGAADGERSKELQTYIDILQITERKMDLRDALDDYKS